MTLKKSALFFACVAAIGLSGCANRVASLESDNYSAGAGFASETHEAIVVAVFPVTITASGEQSNMSQIAGGLVGALLGNAASSGQSSSTRMAVAGVSGVVGAGVAQQVDRSTNTTQGVNIVYRLKDGTEQSVAVPISRSVQGIQAGDIVRVVNSGGQTRVFKVAGAATRQVPQPQATPSQAQLKKRKLS